MSEKQAPRDTRIEKFPPLYEVKPCPFCGGEARIMLEEEDRPDECFHNIYCTSCGVQFWVKSKSEAIAAWNRRAQPENEPLTCDGCEHDGSYENEREYGYPSPCTKCRRIATDNYRRKPERSEG